MPKRSAEWEAGFRAGTEAAAQWLIATAQDYQQMAGRMTHTAMRPVEKLNVGVMDEKAQLLEGQAGHVRNLKP